MSWLFKSARAKATPAPAEAPGAPGDTPTWSSSRKSAVGTAKSLTSRLWFTVGNGIVTELYYQRIDLASTRDFGFFVTDGRDFVCDEPLDTTHETRWMADGVPAFELVNTCKRGRFVLRKRVLVDPDTHVLVQWTRLEPTDPDDALRLFARVAPHLHNQGRGNTAGVCDYKGLPLMHARRDGMALAVACDAGWVKRTVGYVGASDGRDDVLKNKQITVEYGHAAAGNVALTGEVDLSGGREFCMVVAFGQDEHEAGHRARHTLLKGFDRCWDQYRRQWQDWQKTQLDDPYPLDDADGCDGCTHWRVSQAVLAVHESKDFRGGLIASLSSPWGATRGDQDRDGYHVVWPRDCCETVGAMTASGAGEECERVLAFLRCTQEPDGHWPQSMWLSGEPMQNGIQLDEAALPVLAVDLVRRDRGDAIVLQPADYWPMVQRAADFIVRCGPNTEQDRWEHDPGYTASTIGPEIAALLVAADLADEMGQPGLAAQWRSKADEWEACIEAWLYVTDTELSRRVGVEGYYVRIAPQDGRTVPLKGQMVSLANKPPGQQWHRAVDLVSPDALALVRFGLRDANDPKLLDTVKVIDAVTRIETRRGPVWRRYNHDSYGEQADGSAFTPDGGGIGRGWPVLVGERAHYELAAGNVKEAERLLRAMQSMGGQAGLLPEQVWDAPDVPEKDLYNGHPTHSACPLVWSHAEHLKLVRSLADGRVFDLPVRAYERYVKNRR